MPGKLVADLAARPDVRSVGVNAPLTTTWNGWYIKVSDHMNDQLYVDGGFDGDRTNPASGLHMSIAVMDQYFNDTHPVFLDWGGGPSRVRSKWN